MCDNTTNRAFSKPVGNQEQLDSSAIDCGDGSSCVSNTKIVTKSNATPTQLSDKEPDIIRFEGEGGLVRE